MDQTRSWNEVKFHSLIQGKLGKVTTEENFTFYSSSILTILATSTAAQVWRWTKKLSTLDMVIHYYRKTAFSQSSVAVINETLLSCNQTRNR